MRQYGITKHYYLALGCPKSIPTGTLVYVTNKGLITVPDNLFIPLAIRYDTLIVNAIDPIKPSRLLRLIYE